ncbi:cytochrome C biogenesis protein CcsA [Helicobacter didelphidarum]|uniref:Cytochrome C biogenesis protein CcsA n=1 Tax=Helicobacter didelphidarum TaxID=2040648 RepID=A0A3D8IMA6_9HELI|nr:cytochrome-c peroxidase [Helicobacter didelphidarum]RDU66369.1 cytochrome C biogenesis protein CcsA [Helicobacter didelphidarum]
MIHVTRITIGIAVVGAFALAVATTTTLPSPNDLITKAKDSGLESIPAGKALTQYQQQKLKETGIASGYSPLLTKEQIELGKKLYFDPRLSSSNLISCNTCHNLGLAGTDVVPAAIGHKWAANTQNLNSPTVLNSVFNDVQFWDGRAHHLGDQAQGPIENPVEMSAPSKLAVEKIVSIPEYTQEFKKAYGEKVKIDFKLIADTIALYEMTLVTPSRYDKFLNGDTKALTKAEQDGLDTFIEKGCTSCHAGINLGGSMQAFSVVDTYKFEKIGGFKGDKDGLVKTPTLRNIMQTAPYFHNGQYWEITDAIKEMGRIQLGITITDKEAQSIATFFKSLDGQMPSVTYPLLPPVSSKTPKPTF